MYVNMIKNVAFRNMSIMFDFGISDTHAPVLVHVYVNSGYVRTVRAGRAEDGGIAYRVQHPATFPREINANIVSNDCR